MTRSLNNTKKARGGVFEQYETPLWTTTQAIAAGAWLGLLKPGGKYLEPMAGPGKMVRAARAAGLEGEWFACDIQPDNEASLREACGERGTVLIGDMREKIHELAQLAGGRFDVAILNPAFSLTAACLEILFQYCDVVIMLQRDGWIECEERFAFHVLHPISQQWNMVHRPKFAGVSQDSTPYAWFVYVRGYRAAPMHAAWPSLLLPPVEGVERGIRPKKPKAEKKPRKPRKKREPKVKSEPTAPEES